MQSVTLSFIVSVLRACLAQRFPEYVQFQGNSSAPTRGISDEVREALEQADTNPNASHTVTFNSPGNGDWDWTLQISDVNVPAISNSTPDAHVAFTTWHFSRTDQETTPSKRSEDSPVCAYLMDLNFPQNVSSQWNSSNSSCVSALGASCVNALSAARITDNCDAQNAPKFLLNIDSCAGKLDGGPNESDGYVTQGYCRLKPGSRCTFAASADAPSLFCSVQRRRCK